MQIQQDDFIVGFTNDKRWFKGTVSIGKDQLIYVDTQKGEGIEKIFKRLDNFITYQASKLHFPNYTKEDIVQEIKVLALEAIPKYDNTRKSNMITFLQNHIRNRIINLCKFVSEKRRRATFYSIIQCKIRCPDCKHFTKIYNEVDMYTCQSCFKVAPKDDKGWKKYNLPIVPISFGKIEAMTENSNGESLPSLSEIFSDSNENLAFIKELKLPLEERIQKKVDFLKIYEKLDDTNKKIIKMVMEGHTYKDISRLVGISEKSTYARASKIIKGKKI